MDLRVTFARHDVFCQAMNFHHRAITFLNCLRASNPFQVTAYVLDRSILDWVPTNYRTDYCNALFGLGVEAFGPECTDEHRVERSEVQEDAFSDDTVNQKVLEVEQSAKISVGGS